MRNKIEKLRANKRKLQEIRLHIPLISKLTSTICQYHHLSLRLGKVSGLTQRILCTPLFNQPPSTSSKKPYQDTVTGTTSPSGVWIVVLMLTYPGVILVTALRLNHKDPSWPWYQSLIKQTTVTYSNWSETRCI